MAIKSLSVLFSLLKYFHGYLVSTKKFLSNICNNKTISNENFPDYGRMKNHRDVQTQHDDPFNDEQSVIIRASVTTAKVYKQKSARGNSRFILLKHTNSDYACAFLINTTL